MSNDGRELGSNLDDSGTQDKAIFIHEEDNPTVRQGDGEDENPASFDVDDAPVKMTRFHQEPLMDAGIEELMEAGKKDIQHLMEDTV